MPTNLYQIDSIIIGYDIILQLLFAFITIFLSWYSYKIYKITCQEQTKFLSLGFFLIGIAYTILSVFNFLIIEELLESISRIVHLKEIILLNTIGLYAHMSLMIAGLVALTFMTFKTKTIRSLILLLAISLIAIIFSKSPLETFFLISSILLAGIVYFFTKNCIKKRNRKTKTITLAFLFLLLGNLVLLLISRSGIYYLIYNLFEAVAYLLILYNLYLVRKR